MRDTQAATGRSHLRVAPGSRGEGRAAAARLQPSTCWQVGGREGTGRGAGQATCIPVAQCHVITTVAVASGIAITITVVEQRVGALHKW